jgi:uncharacterized protein DUF6390
MTALPDQQLPVGHALFARYALPPNELGYCGPTDTPADELGRHAREFDGAWPYLRAIADAAGLDDPLAAEVVHSYWVGGPLLDRVEPTALLTRLRTVFKGQVTGLLGDLADPAGALAHHSFHVFVVYPWVRFLDRDPATALRVMQDCRIGWGTVESVDGECAVVRSRRLKFDADELALGDEASERLRWSKDGVALITAPAPGASVSAHWDWVCGTLTDADCRALATATQATLDVVNRFRHRS